MNEQAQGSGAIVTLALSAVPLIQQAMNQAGYNAGNLDGNWDSQVQTAVRRFQQANNLEPTGTLTTDFLARIGMPQWYAGQVLRFNPSVARGQGGGQGAGMMTAGNQGGFVNNQGRGGAMAGGGQGGAI